VICDSTASGMLVNVAIVLLVESEPPQTDVSLPLVKTTGLSFAR